MKWFKKRKKAEDVPLTDEEMGIGLLGNLSMDEHVIATENVMACRDLLNVYIGYIHEHRQNGHECLPYCTPGALLEHLHSVTGEEAKLILIVALKDMYNVYVNLMVEDA